MGAAPVLTLPALPATLTHVQATAYLAQCSAALASAGRGTMVQVDASALREFDSSALAVLLAVRREVLARGAQWRLSGLNERARVLAGLYGVAELLPA
ncbi:MAG: STAS domain-containing protein [Tepidimonas sp.]|uniref:STAS domain-containing protein n=1 Tax=Tepidimonas sp. TaxID=2002775 RepID=UPI00259D7872|nr:STAS domain-containing protein [Tepidimonas sp.]MDM7456785.1 STAS domain-containing protein [Tepidimonas sp.]